jgi:hypothetical protein
MDATMKGPDAVFALLRTYLKRLGITQADQVLFIADGAPWIWKRVPLLVKALGLAAHQVYELLDFYHAVEHLGQVAAQRKDWSAKARSRWRTRQRRALLRGQVEQVIAAVRAICRGRNSKAIRTHRDYFIKNRSRMAYAELKAMKLPIGSGAIESTVRRVVNLRLKGASLFWCRASAEAILLLRSYYKAGVNNRRSHCAHQKKRDFSKKADITLAYGNNSATTQCPCNVCTGEWREGDTLLPTDRRADEAGLYRPQVGSPLLADPTRAPAATRSGLEGASGRA